MLHIRAALCESDVSLRIWNFFRGVLVLHGNHGYVEMVVEKQFNSSMSWNILLPKMLSLTLDLNLNYLLNRWSCEKSLDKRINDSEKIKLSWLSFKVLDFNQVHVQHMYVSKSLVWVLSKKVPWNDWRTTSPRIAIFSISTSAVMMAARSLIQLYRKVNPDMLLKKDKVWLIGVLCQYRVVCCFSLWLFSTKKSL